MGPHLGQNPVAQVAHGTTHGYQNLKDSSLNSQFVPFKEEKRKNSQFGSFCDGDTEASAIHPLRFRPPRPAPSAWA
jgi:hypothetical protein